MHISSKLSKTLSFSMLGGCLIAIIGCSGPDKINRAKQPEAGDPPDIEIADYQRFTMENGMKVFVVQDPNMPSVTYTLDLNRPPLKSGDKSGYTALVGQMMGTATENREKDELNEAIDFIGASFNASSTGFYASSLKKHHQQLVKLAADVVKNPVFKQSEFEKQKKQLISSIKSSENSPGAIASRVYDRLIYGKDHPYADIRTVETVKNIKLEDIKSYYEKYYDPGIGYMAVVGNVSKSDIKPIIKKHFGDWESEGTPPEKDYETPKPPKQRQVAVVNRSSAEQSTLRIGHPVDLQRKDSNYFAARLANTILGSPNFRLFMNLREDKAYTYGAYSRISADEKVGSFTASADVSNKATDSAIMQVLKEMRKMRENGVTQEELSRAKNYITGNFAIGLEDARTVARYAINIEQKDLPSGFYQNYLKRINGVKKPAVKAAAQSYIKPENSHVLVVGKASAFEGKLSQFGPVSYYTKFGKPTKAPSEQMSSTDMTAQQVINNYIKAIGGAEALKKVEGLRTQYQTKIRGRQLQIIQERKAPGMYRQVTKIGGMVQQEQLYDGETAFMKSPRTGGKKEITGKPKDRLAVFSNLFYLHQLDELGVKAKVEGVTGFNDQQAYKVKLTTEDGYSWHEFFAKDDFLKIGKRQTLKTPRGSRSTTVIYGDYQTKQGIKFPHTMTQSMGPRQFELKLADMAINPGLSKSNFTAK